MINLEGILLIVMGDAPDSVLETIRQVMKQARRS
jgi:hypothetical protein